MANKAIEDIILDPDYDKRETEYVRQHLPAELQERYSDDDIRRLTDAIADYFINSGILDAPDGSDEGEVDIELEDIARAVAKTASDEANTYDPEDVFFVVQADIDFTEQ